MGIWLKPSVLFSTIKVVNSSLLPSILLTACTDVPIDKDHFLEELSDALHFLVQLFIELGLTAEDVFSLYFKKSEVNKFRIRSNY